MQYEKLENSEALATMLKDLRLSHPVDGKPLTAHELSLKMGKNRAWVSQLESRRLKKVKTDDVLKLYRILLNTDATSAEAQFQKDYAANISTNSFFEQTFKTLHDTVLTKYLSLEEPENKKKLLTLISNLENGFNNNFFDLIDLLYDFDFSMLNKLPSKQRGTIINGFANSKQLLNRYKALFLLQQTLQESSYVSNNIRKKQSNPMDCIEHLKKGLSYISKIQIHEMHFSIKEKYIDVMNKFLLAVKEYSSCFFSYMLFDIPTIQNFSEHNMQQTLQLLRQHLDEIEHNINFHDIEHELQNQIIISEFLPDLESLTPTKDSNSSKIIYIPLKKEQDD